MKQSGRKWGDLSMLMGEYHHNIDEKSRLIIPAKFRSELGERFVITKGLDKCLFVYSETEWNKLMQKVASIYLPPCFKFKYSITSFNNTLLCFINITIEDIFSYLFKIIFIIIHITFKFFLTPYF